MTIKPDLTALHARATHDCLAAVDAALAATSAEEYARHLRRSTFFARLARGEFDHAELVDGRLVIPGLSHEPSDLEDASPEERDAELRDHFGWSWPASSDGT